LTVCDPVPHVNGPAAPIPKDVLGLIGAGLVTDPLPPVVPAGPCVTVKLAPPMVSVADRSAPALAATVYPSITLPDPDVAFSVIQFALLEADHAHELGADTVIALDPPSPAKLAELGNKPLKQAWPVPSGAGIPAGA